MRRFSPPARGGSIFQDMLSPELRERYRPAPGDERLWVMLCRRATMETVIRRHAAALPGVTIRNRVRVTGLRTETPGPGPLVVSGLTLEGPDGEEAVSAGLVIDASGRTSRFPGWLRDLGRHVQEQDDDAQIVYYTRHYRLAPGEAEPGRDGPRGAGDLGYLKFGVFPGDNGHFAIILCLPVQERALQQAVRDPAHFDAICRSIPGLAPWLERGRASATTEPFGIADIHAVWRRFEAADGTPLALNFFAVGDAALRTNPLYGRGCSTGLLHARMLTDVLEETRDPVQRARRFAERTEAELRPIFDASLREDQSGIRRAAAVLAGEPLDQPDSLKRWFRLAFGDALAAAARSDIDVLRGMLRSFHLLETPGDFLKEPRIRRKVLLRMLRGRRRNAANRYAAGPERDALHTLLGLAADGR